MTEVFLTVADMSLKAGYVILIILLVRLLLRRAPKKYSYALWSAACFRLLCPVGVALPFSLLYAPRTGNSGVTSFSPVDVVEDVIQPVLTETVTAALPEPTQANSVDPIQVFVWGAALIWCLGMAALLLYAGVSLVRVYRQMSTAVRLRDNVWQSDRISSPFILGVFRPRIIIPFGLEGEALDYVLAHERFHLKRLDHLVKPAAWLIAAVHWFNPLVWLAFRAMSRDMEMRCDEAVLTELEGSGKRYSATLLTFAAKERFPAPNPLAFGEGGVSRRVKNALNWKKPRFWVTAVSLVVCLAVVIGCVADPWKNKAAEVVGPYDVSLLGHSEVWAEEEAYAIGANCYGMPVFVDTNAAWRKLKQEHGRALDCIAESFHLLPLNRFNWELYGTYGCQVTVEDEELRRDCSFVSAFFDIYENSYMKSGPAGGVPTAETITYTGKGGAFVGQHIALSFMPADGSYFARVTLVNGEVTIVSSDDEVLYQGHYDSTESWSREQLLEKLNVSPLWPYGAGSPDTREARWDAMVPEFEGLNMERLTFRTPASDEVAWMLYLFNGKPTWLVWGGENGRYFELVPTE